MKSMKNTIKLTEAIKEGYTHFMCQSTNLVYGLDEITPIHIENGAELLEKEHIPLYCHDAETIIEDLAENITVNAGVVDGDDIYNAIKSVDPELLTDFINTVNQKLKPMKYYPQTHITITHD